MNAKELLAQATKKLEAHKPTPASPSAIAPPPALLEPSLPEGKVIAEDQPPQEGSGTVPLRNREAKPGREKNKKVKNGPTQKKGITLRPGNLKKLDELELSLRKQGVKANHSGLIQIAIEKLQDGADLIEAYREIIKQDLRFR